MFAFILKRILQSIPVLLTVITITFFLMRIAPGGPFSNEKNLPKEIMNSLNEQYHLNDPLYKQYFNYLSQIAQGDFGPSFKYPGLRVTKIIADSFSESRYSITYNC